MVVADAWLGNVELSSQGCNLARPLHVSSVVRRWVSLKVKRSYVYKNIPLYSLLLMKLLFIIFLTLVKTLTRFLSGLRKIVPGKCLLPHLKKGNDIYVRAMTIKWLAERAHCLAHINKCHSSPLIRQRIYVAHLTSYLLWWLGLRAILCLITKAFLSCIIYFLNLSLYFLLF
jgi:hypothetical protein